ncbi:MAG: amidohydrolase family protein [Armatimonadota bacterium]
MCERENIEYVACSSALALQYDMEAGNAEVADAVSHHEPLLGYVYVNPNYLSSSMDQMQRYLCSEDFVGVKIHPRFSNTPENAPEMAKLIAAVADHADLLLMHTVDQNAAVQMGRYAEAHSGLSIVLAHAAHTDYIAAARVAAEQDNIYLDFCCEWPGSGKIRKAIEICGAEKIVFGTDMDLLDPSFTRGMFEEARLSDDEQTLIYRENARRLLGFSEPMDAR